MKKRVNITVDEELHEWAVKHFGEREFSKAISDQLICISSSVDAVRKVVDEESCRDKLEIDLEEEKMQQENKVKEELVYLPIFDGYTTVTKLPHPLQGTEVGAELVRLYEEAQGVDGETQKKLIEKSHSLYRIHEAMNLAELAQKYENLEDGEGYPLQMSEEQLATMIRVTKKTNLMDEELRRKKIQARVEEILLPMKMELTKALFEIEKEVSSKFARIRL